MSEIIKRVIDLAIEIQQIPAPTFEEAQRAEFVRDLFIHEALTEVSVDASGNVFACLPRHRLFHHKRKHAMLGSMTKPKRKKRGRYFNIVTRIETNKIPIDAAICLCQA